MLLLNETECVTGSVQMLSCFANTCADFTDMIRASKRRRKRRRKRNRRRKKKLEKEGRRAG